MCANRASGVVLETGSPRWGRIIDTHGDEMMNFCVGGPYSNGLALSCESLCKSQHIAIDHFSIQLSDDDYGNVKMSETLRNAMLDGTFR